MDRNAGSWGTCGTMRVLVGLVYIVALFGVAQPAYGQGFYPRGDTDCTLTFTAADTVATARGIGGDSSCTNDDCNRDGVIDADDIDCAIGCLFSGCATPPNAPLVTAIQPDTAAGIAPFTTIHVKGTNFGPDDRPKRVVIGGVDAEIVDFIPPDELVVVVPSLPTGETELEVHDGDLVGFRMPIAIHPQTPIGQPDTFDGTLDLLDTALSRFQQLDLDSAFGDDAVLVGSAIETFREQLAEQRDALETNPAFTAQIRADLDAAYDSSELPDMLRDLLSQIDDLQNGNLAPGGVPGDGNAQGTFAVAAIAARNTLAAGRALIAVGSTVASVGAAGLSAPLELAALGAGIAVGVLTLAGSAALPPIILRADFYLGNGGHSNNDPTPNGVVVVTGSRLIRTHLVLRTKGGPFVLEAEADNDQVRQFRLPGDAVGFCGRITVLLERSFPLAGTSNAITRNMFPQLTRITGRNPAVPFDDVELEAHAMSGCDGEITFVGDPDGNKRVNYDWLSPVRIEVRVPDVKPGPYALFPIVQNYVGIPLNGLNIESAVTGVEVECTPLEIRIPPGQPDTSRCSASELPARARRPENSYYFWKLSDADTASLDFGSADFRREVRGKLPGTTTVSAVLRLENENLASTASPPTITVTDGTAPSVFISSSAASEVVPGTAIPVSVTASDNVVVTRIRLIASGGSVLNGEQEFPCAELETSCQAAFNVNIASTVEANQNQVTIMAEAFDGSGNKGTSRTLSFTVKPGGADTTCPVVSIESPAAGGTVNAGAGVQVVAHATDDVGVKRFHYTASGDALVNQIDQQLPFPTALAMADLRFSFTVKSSDDLKTVNNRSITIQVDANDEAGNTCSAVSVVSVIGVLDNCSGSISTDKAAGYIDEPFTITVTITGDAASEVTRVTSVNPGGNFDLTPRGNGVYNVTLFYQGQGTFTLSFTAFDAANNARCSGSIGLEALGPKPG